MATNHRIPDVSQFTLDRTILDAVIDHAATAAASLVRQIANGTAPGDADLLAEYTDKIAQVLCELLGLSELFGNPHLVAASAHAAPGAPLEALLEHVAPAVMLGVLLEHAASVACRLVCKIEDGTAPGHARDLLAERLDQIALLCRLLGNRYLIAANAHEGAS